MTIQLRAYLNSDECELYRAPDDHGIIAYVPSKATCKCEILLGTKSFTTAEVVARALGLEPNWN